mgnify:CR=1 FL=1
MLFRSQEGFQLLEYGRYLNTYGGGVLKTDKPLFNPETNISEGKSIILSLEGGYGDEIINARFATNLKDVYNFEHVYIACDPSIATLFARIKGVSGVITRAESDKVKHDYWLPGFSAGWVCGIEHNTLSGDPYLSANPESVNLWKEILKSDKIGRAHV